ncbi:haloacid dehalogenase [Pseudoxanthomonas kalamensis DSM 18571]|nr:haloacid dehalogenase [Pseudoxanthomonas kalamensis DSM 18571]
MKKPILLAACIAALASACAMVPDAGPLPSWNDTAPKEAVIEFVARVTTKGSPDFVPVPERIAVFDNDGTLWAEQPVYTQLAFIIDQIKAMAPQHPEWNTTEPFASLLAGDMQGVMASGEAGVAALLAAPHAGMSTDEFSHDVLAWIETARHPKTGAAYTQMTYQPMLELLEYLRANGFKTFIVSGGGIDFMRPWSEQVYGIPPEQVVGTSGGLAFEDKNGQYTLRKLPELVLNDDKAGKPVGIQRHIGRRPIAAFGNSDGDLQMLQWTCAAPGARLCTYIHHTDEQREWAYDRQSHIGKLDLGLDEAHAKGWTVVDMKQDWKVVFPAQ